jgi:hypothetical protein
MTAYSHKFGLLACFLLLGCSRETQYAGHNEAYWEQQVAHAVDPDERAKAATALSHFNTIDAKSVLHLVALQDPDCSVRLCAAESLYFFDHQDPYVNNTIRSVIHDKLGWAVTDTLTRIIKGMGKDALPLSDDIQQVYDAAPVSKQKRWLECLDAIRDSRAK